MKSQLYVRKASAGSGKTFTLAAHYVALLLHGESYKSILAVTFTNKATAEMKERILTYLHAIARETTLAETQGFLNRVREIYHELGYNASELTDAVSAKRAEACFLAILSDYDNMRVCTIDAFLQSLLAGMVQMLGTAVGYSVELDTQRVISRAADQLLTHGAQEPIVCNALVRYMGEQLDEERHWDIRKGLINIANELYSELLLQHAEELVTDEQVLASFKKQMNWRIPSVISPLQQALEPCTSWTEADFSNGRYYLSRIRAYQSLLNGGRCAAKDAFMPFSPSVIRAIETAESFEKAYKGNGNAEEVRERLHRISAAAAPCRKAYLRSYFCTKHLNDLVLMKHLQRIIENALKENNTRLLCVTANTLARTLKRGDADFILEKAGIRYRHIMLDEFQDTSTLQWANFSKLIQELLSNEQGSTLIVGDIKQSIYRWRNGDWRIMNDLPYSWKDYYNDQMKPLVRNFRSEREVVKFNIDTFKRLAEAENNPLISDIYDVSAQNDDIRSYYREGHEHGYVRIHRYKRDKAGTAEDIKRLKQQMVTQMFEDIQRLLEHGIEARDMMILIRNNREAKIILSVFDQLKEDEQHIPLRSVRLISNDCFKLNYSSSVKIIIAALRFIFLKDEVAKAFLQLAKPELSIDTLLEEDWTTRSLVDAVEQITRLYLCRDGWFSGGDLAYLTAFMDMIRSYVSANGSNIKLFLADWNERLYDKSIPASDENGIKLMTIHASKGLEADNVFIPFCNWKMEEDKQGEQLWCAVSELCTSEQQPALLPIPQQAAMCDAGFADEYEQEHQLQRIDNLNLLYVALTRAAKRLYIHIDVTSSGLTKDYRMLSVAYLLYQCCDQDEYGIEFWEENKQNPKLSNNKKTEPFSFRNAPEIRASYFSSDEHVHFKQSQNSRNFGWNIATGELKDNKDDNDRKVFGTLCHELLGHIHTYPNPALTEIAVRELVKDAYNQGIIPTETWRDEIMQTLLSTVTNDKMINFFTGDWNVLCEETVVFINEDNEVEERRMDRVLRQDETHTAIVIDYKFGKDDPKYDLQVRRYMSICRQMGFTNVKGYLWIAQEQKLNEVFE